MWETMLDNERVEFFSTCKDKSNVAAYCTHLTTAIRHKDPGANVVIKYFVADNGPCKDKTSVQAYCARWTTYDGIKLLLDEPDGYPDPYDPDLNMPTQIVDRTAKLCGATRDALLAKFCAGASASKSRKDWELALEWCPREGKEIYMRNCVGRQNEFRQTVTTKQCEEGYASSAKKF
jgi:hypothetical protein